MKHYIIVRLPISRGYRHDRYKIFGKRFQLKAEMYRHGEGKQRG
jgi:hypothetical protein